MKMKILMGAVGLLTCFPSFAADNSSNPPKFGFEKQNQIDIVPEDMNADAFFNTGDAVKPRVNPVYELGVEVGAFLPTDASTLFNLEYNQKTMYGKISLGRIFWLSNLAGFTFGVKGMYATNTGTNYVPDTTTPLYLYQHSFYAASGEGFASVRFRSHDFLFLQPGFYASAGVMQYQETATAYDTTQYANYTVAETSYLYSLGGFCDLSISAFAQQTEMDNSSMLNEVLLRVTGSYSRNSTQTALAMTGFYVGAGVVFLIN